MTELGKIIASQVNTLNNVLSSTPPNQATFYLSRLEQEGQFTVLATVDPNVGPPPMHGVLIALLYRSIRDHLDPSIPMYYSAHPTPQLVFGLNVGGKRCWLATPIEAHIQSPFPQIIVALSVIKALIALLVAMLIQRRINRPLRDIADAAHKIGDGGRLERLPLYDANELAAVAKQFNTMVDSLDEMESTRTIMLAGISHDIRTPLTKLRLAFAMDKAEQESTYIRYIEQIDSIVGQFLDFGRGGHGEEPLMGDLNAMVRQIARMFEERGHSFQLSLFAIPEFEFRPTAMSRILMNLMDNAMKYGQSPLEVRSWYERRSICISVLDSGPGLPKDYNISSLTTPFVRGDASRSEISGTGLGLAIVDRLVRLHGGHFLLRNRRNGGTEARVTFYMDGALNH
jgi:two-component system, OmpR family, osmolarity sensor histidine kinase EnvZ